MAWPGGASDIGCAQAAALAKQGDDEELEKSNAASTHSALDSSG